MEAVRIISSELFKPARTREDDAPIFKLTPFDNIMRNVPYQQRVLFYRSLGQASFEEFLQLLKSSLAEVLVIFYPFAGRIVVRQEEDDQPMELHPGLGQSVKLTLAETGSTLDQLGEFEPSEFIDSLCELGSPPPKFPLTVDHPLLFIQITRFSCGGVSLGFAFSHQLVDGVSAWQFMISWAELARTGSLRELPEIKYEFEEQERIVAVTAAVKAAMTSETPSAPPGMLGPKRKEQVVTKQFKLDREAIEKLKGEAAAGADGKRFTTFVVVSAYFWRRITFARGMSNVDPGFIFLVNCRGRFSSLGKTYFGNAITGTRACLEHSQVHRGISHWAGVLQEAITSFDKEAAMNTVGYMNWLVSHQNDGVMLGDNNMSQAIGSPRHPVYETDFGFGKPAGVTLGRGDLDDGKIYLFPSVEGDGSVAVTVVLKPENMERFLQQES